MASLSQGSLKRRFSFVQYRSAQVDIPLIDIYRRCHDRKQFSYRAVLSSFATPTNIPNDPPPRHTFTGYYFGRRACRAMSKMRSFLRSLLRCLASPLYQRLSIADRQIKEAEDYLKQANKCLQKTITRWNPNYFSAAPLFEKVGYWVAWDDRRCHATW